MDETLPKNDAEYEQIDQLYDECLSYLKAVNESYTEHYITKEIENYSFDDGKTDPIYETIKTNEENKNIKTSEDNKTIITNGENETGKIINEAIIQHSKFKVENEIGTSATSIAVEVHSERLRRLSEQLPKIIITQSNNSLNVKKEDQREKLVEQYVFEKRKHNNANLKTADSCSLFRQRAGYGDFPKRLVSKSGVENVALISNVPFEKIRLLNDAFHTLINLRWRWIVSGTIVLHFSIWLVFALFWYTTALAHYDLEPSPPPKSCVTGGHDFVTIFLASVEAQTTIGFGDRAIDEECPESIFLFIMQLILGTGLSGVLTCVVYAKLTRPEKLSRYGVGFSKKAVISVRDGRLCLMLRAWDLNYDHIIGSEFTAHFINTYRTNEGESLRYFARPLRLQQRQFLLWPVVLVHVIDETSPLFNCSPEILANRNYEITVSLKGASASMGTFTQSQTSYLPKEVVWGYRFPSVVRYNSRKQKYVIDYKKLHSIEPVDTPYCSASQLNRCSDKSPPGTPSSFVEKMISFQINRTSSFNKKKC